MSKLAYVTDNLHRIGDEIANASAHGNAGGQKEQTPAPECEDPPLDKTSYYELRNLRRELRMKLEENVSFYSSRAELLKQELAPVQVSEEKMRSLLEEFEKLPDCDSVKTSSFRSALAECEKIRIEIFRAEAHAEKLRAKREGGGGSGRSGSDFSNIPSGVLFRKGFIFFLPLLIGVLFCSVILACAFVAAWKMAF